MIVAWSVIVLCLTLCSCDHVGNVSQKCMQDTNAFLSEIHKDEPSKYAVLMYDAFGKLGSDIEGGNVNRPGSLEECQLVNGPGFSGQYCHVFLKQDETQYFVGVCVPDSCDEEEVQALVVYDIPARGAVSDPPIPPPILTESTQGIYTTECFTKIAPDFAIIISLFVCSLLIAVPLAATAYIAVIRWRRRREVGPGVDSPLSATPNHYGTILSNGTPKANTNGCAAREATQMEFGNTREDKSKKSRLYTFMETVSLQTNAVGVWNMAGGGESYSSLNGIRILSLLWIICGHNVQFSAFNNFDNNKRWREAVDNNPLYLCSFSGPVYLAVDTFLILGGLLSAKSFMASVQSADDTLSARLIASYLFKRLKRVQPLHIFIVCLAIGGFSIVPRGSFWFMAADEVANCRKYWWSNVLLINNLLTVTDIVVRSWSWYLSVDFQFYATTPLMIYFYRLNKFALFAVAAVLLVIPIVAGGLITAWLQIPVHQPSTMESEAFYEYYYNKPWTRYGPYLIGILAGIYMKTKKGHIVKHQWQAALGWISSMIVMALVVWLAYVLRAIPDELSAPHAVYQGLHRTLWALAVSWIILACEEGYGGFINKLLSMKFWIPLSNISFACYMIHPLLIVLYNGEQETPTHYTSYNYFYLFLGHTVMSMIIGYVLTVLIEKPYMFLKRCRG